MFGLCIWPRDFGPDWIDSDAEYQISRPLTSTENKMDNKQICYHKYQQTQLKQKSTLHH